MRQPDISYQQFKFRVHYWMFSHFSMPAALHTCSIHCIHVNSSRPVYTPSQKINKQNCFCYNCVRPPNLTIFRKKTANSLKLYEVQSFSTSSNLCQCTTVFYGLYESLVISTLLYGAESWPRSVRQIKQESCAIAKMTARCALYK